MAFAFFAICTCFLGSPVGYAQIVPNPGPIVCKVPTPVCAYQSNGAPDLSCVKNVTSLTVPNGSLDPTGNYGGQYNDGSACGTNRSTHKPCGDYITKQGTCGDSSGPPVSCNPFDPDSDCCDPFLVDCGGGGGDPCWGALGGDCGDSAPLQPLHSVKAAEARLRSLPTQGMPASAKRLVQQLAALGSVHMKSRVLMWEAGENGKAPRTSITEYEYWESGPRYRIHTYVDPKMGFHDITDIAFDGSHYQQLQRLGQDLFLAKSSADERMIPLPIDNPLVLPLAFLSPQDEQQCALCELRLSDLRVLAQLTAQPSPKISAPGSSDATKEAKGWAYEVAGGKSFGQDTVYRVAMDAAGRLIQHIQLVTKAGAVLTDITLDKYNAVEGSNIELPRRIEVSRSTDQEAEPWLILKFVVDQVEFNKPLDAATFVIPESAAALVWDGDLRKYTKRAVLSSEGLCSAKN
jgi:hypothetical protein